MNPRLGSVFPEVMGDAVRSVGISKVLLSKGRRRMRIIFEYGTSPQEADTAAAAVKSVYHLADMRTEIEQRESLSENRLLPTGAEPPMTEERLCIFTNSPDSLQLSLE